MHQLNVQISEHAHRAAKIAAVEAGLQLRQWVERALLTQALSEASDRIAAKIRSAR